jgi:hypothetical protein
VNCEAQNHLLALFRARVLAQHGSWAPHVPHTFGLPAPDAVVAPVVNVGPQLLEHNAGAVSEAPGQQIVAPQPYAWLNAATPTGLGATAQNAASIGGGAISIRQDFVVPPVPLAETDPMKMPLIPPADITPEAAIVAYPKPIHAQSFPLNRYPLGVRYNHVVTVV